VKLTPTIGGELIHYSVDQLGRSGLQAIGSYGLEGVATALKDYGVVRHKIEPYFSFQGTTTPTLSPDVAPIFNIQDGLSELQLVKVGLKNGLYARHERASSWLFANLDIWAYGLYGTTTTFRKVPRLYASLNTTFDPSLITRLDIGYNRELNQFDLLNLFLKYSYNEDFACTLDLLTRGYRYWRKAQYENFMLDAFEPETVLENSILSDRRNTFLGHLFYRIHPNWELTYRIRIGWNRQYEDPYLEYKAECKTFISSNWAVRFGYEHREIDNRFLFSFHLSH
jgi:hypothetical protein